MLLKLNVVTTLIQVLSIMRALAPAASTSPVPVCESRCGNLTFEFPFGIGSPDCYPNKWFKILCYNDRPHLRIHQDTVEVLYIDGASQRVTIRSNTSNMRVCEDTSKWLAGNLTGSPFYFSLQNKFMLLGCGNAILSVGNDYRYGCTSVCEQRSIDRCYGINCCQDNSLNDTVYRNYNFTEYYLNFSNSVTGKKGCASAFLVDFKWYPGNASLFSDPSADLAGVSIPLVLGWTPVPGMGYNGNCIFTREGCQGQDLGVGDFYTGRFSPTMSILISLMVVVIMLTTFCSYKTIKRRVERKLKRKRFKQNGGLLLDKYLSSNKNIMEKVRIFTSKALKKATDHFNEDRVLGRGGQGTVYKGMLGDGKIVAIKKSKLLADGNQVEEFINEIIILSQIDHRNVVKLFGCCLDMDVPILVYEFIPNGTLYNLIHNENVDFPLTWEVRLKISLEVAEALDYLHSATSIPVYHRDIKSSNILLDEKYKAKVADFGTSRHTGIDKTHLTTLVKGTFGYLDPEYFQSSQFTKKSDVYSYGVVLVELLTGLKPISFYEEEESHINLATRFLLAVEENYVDNILDPQVKEAFNEEECKVIIKLSQRCLNVNGRNRPSMKEIVWELQSMKNSHSPSIVPSSETEVKLAGIPSINLMTSSDVSSLLSSSF